MIYIDDYKGYKESNKSFFKTLEDNSSLVYDRFNDILKVLGYVEMMHDTNSLDEDLETIFESGYSYFYEQMEMVKIIYKNYYNSNYQKFSKYEVVINYYLYLEDLLATLSEDKKINKKVKEGLEKILDKIDNLLANQNDFEESFLDELDSDVESLSINNPPLTTQEVFGMIVEELEI